MALLNKLFFPSSSTSTTTTTLPTPPPSTPAAPALVTPSAHSQTNILSRTSSLSSGVGTVTAAAAAASSAATVGTNTTSSSQRNNTKFGGNNKRSNYNQSTHSKNYLSQFPFDGSQVRILVYRECDSRGRRLLFDSNALEKVYLKEHNGNISSNITSKSNAKATTGGHTNININNNHKETLDFNNIQQQQASNKGHSNGSFIEVCEEYGYKHNRPNSTDIASVGEMVFGALAMSFRGTSLKVHWLDSPSKLLCSQVFLTPTRQASGHSPYSTLSTNSLATPRTSICSEHGSIDGLSMSSFSLPFSVGIGRHISLTPSDLSTSVVSSPLDVPSIDQQSILTSSESAADSGPRFSSTCSTGNDSGYSALSRGQLSSDQWSSSYQYSTRSSLGSVMSEQSERLRKFSVDSNLFPGSSGHPLELSSDGSLQRRISRNMMTSFENENSMNDLIGFVTDNYSNVCCTNGGSEGINLGVNYRRASYSTNESRSNPEMGRRRDAVANMKSNSRRAKLGLAVCVTMSESFEEEMELFCSEHIALMESMLSRLRASTERAYIHHNHFLQIMFQVWQDTQQWFQDLFTAPRIKCPVWLSITTSGSKYSKNVAERFMKELCWLLSFADTKDTNFFISTMLTAILTHHLGWVPTVSPFNSSSSTAAIEQRAKLLQVSQKHPYNALWAQMGDLFGAIGLPPKLARTVIYGTEKLSIERLLNVLTYFIRCGEVRRSPKKEDFNKQNLNEIVAQNKNEAIKKSTVYGKKTLNDGSKKTVLMKPGTTEGTLTRTPSCKKNLSLYDMDVNEEILERDEDECENDDDEEDEEEDEDEVELTDEAIRTYKKNEIPTVLAFRDSHFVQQELRIGNYLMDTGIEKNSVTQFQQGKQKESSSSCSSSSNKQKEGRIRLTLTTPDNIELNVEETNLEVDSGVGGDDDGVMEAIEIDVMPTNETKTSKVLKQDAMQQNILKKKPFFWSMTPISVKEGLSLTDLNKLQQCLNKNQQQQQQQHQTANTEQPNLQRKSQQLSLSDLITQNSMGKSDRMTWGVEPVKENVSLEEHIHFDFCRKLTEREHGIGLPKEKSSGGVVFVLGDNEPLVNIKRSTEDLTQDVSDCSSSKETNKKSLTDTQQQLLCPLHQRMHKPATTTTTSTQQQNQQQQQMMKKHSGVKFNFEQYPQIVTNYMKSKNLLMSNYDLLMDKCTKLELQQQQQLQQGGSGGGVVTQIDGSTLTAQTAAATTINTFPQNSTTGTTSTSCMICNGLLNAYQTPSNATELEFETDDFHSFANPNIPSSTAAAATTSQHSLPTVSSQTSIQTLISNTTPNALEELSEVTNNDGGIKTVHNADETNVSTALMSPKESRKKQFNTNQKKLLSQRSSVSSVAVKCAAVNEAMHLLKLPLPGVKELPQEDEPPGDMKLPVGFVPSLFLSVNDHYIPDMLLQGTFASPTKWEMNLREDLALAAHSASLISLPAENIAIIADMENWDVKLLSSQSQHFPYAGGQSAPVGMSQLVSSMLETVQTMNSAGIPAYEKSRHTGRQDTKKSPSIRLQQIFERKAKKLYLKTTQTLEQSTGFSIKKATSHSEHLSSEEYADGDQELDKYLVMLLGLQRLLNWERALMQEIIPTSKQSDVFAKLAYKSIDMIVKDAEAITNRIVRSISRKEWTSALGIFKTLKNVLLLQPDIDRTYDVQQREQLTKVLSKLQNTGSKALEHFLEVVRGDSTTNIVGMSSSTLGYVNVPKDATVHELTSNTIWFIENLLNHYDVIGVILMPDVLYSTQLETILMKKQLSEEDKNKALLAIYIKKALAELNLSIMNKCEQYNDQATKHLFRLNNINYILNSLITSNLIDIITIAEADCRNSYIETIKELKFSYQKTWSKMLSNISPLDELPKPTQGKVKDKDRSILKEKFLTFNKDFEEACKIQRGISIPDVTLRQGIKRDNEEHILPKYNEFFNMYSGVHFSKNPDKYIKYKPHEIKACLNKLFDDSA